MSAAASMQRHESAKRELNRLLRNLAGLMLGFALAAWVCFANAAMTGLQFDGRCIESQAEVLNTFKLKVQQVSTGLNFELCGAPWTPIITNNTSYTGQSAPLAIKYWPTSEGSSGVDVCNSESFRVIGLPPCDPDVQSLAFTGTNALFLVLGFFYAAMLGFKTGYRA